MKKLLLTIFLFAQFVQFAPEAVRGQTAPTPAGATQEAATPAAGQADAVKEADSLSRQVVQLYQAGKFDEALPLAERALKLREEAGGREHPSVAQALRNLAAIYHSKSKLDKARQLYKRALSIYEKHPAATSRVNIYKLHDALGVLERFAFNNFIDAIENYERSLALKQSSLGAEHEDVIKTLYELAELYELLAHNDKALATHRRVIGIMEKREATKPYDLILALSRFVCLSERLKMKTETAAAERRIEEIRAREEAQREQEAKALPGVQISGDETVRGGVINGRAISKPQPNYPGDAKRYGISGTVTIFVTVDETGRVIEAYPCGHPILSEASLRAAYRARFTPTLLDGKPVKVRGVITYNFVLQ
ncbi:MAG TPA: TonB family protein [Pyrinomonadaceae bacterium]